MLMMGILESNGWGGIALIVTIPFFMIHLIVSLILILFGLPKFLTIVGVYLCMCLLASLWFMGDRKKT